MNEFRKLAYEIARTSVQHYSSPLVKTAAAPALLLPLLARLGGFLLSGASTAGIFMGMGHLVQNFPYIKSWLTGSGAIPLTEEERKIYHELAEKHSRRYAAEKAIETVAAKYGLAPYLQDLHGVTALVHLPLEDRERLYETQRRKIRFLKDLEKAHEQQKDLAFGPWGPTWKQWGDLRFKLQMPDSHPELPSGTDVA